jgi:hypothetical protein
MTSSTLDSNGRLQRKTLSNQIDRLDGMLEGLAENLNDAVALAVKETVAQVVREAVELAVKEVLSNPELLRAAQAQHSPPAPPQQPPAPKAQRRSCTDVLQSGWSWLCRKVTRTASHARKKLGQGLSWCVQKVSQGCAALWHQRRGWVVRAVGTLTALAAAAVTLWHFRRSCSVALTAGLITGVSGYLAGPVVGALLSGLGGMGLTLSAMVLLPLWNLWRTPNASNSPH